MAIRSQGSKSMMDKSANPSLEELEIDLLLEGVRRYYGYDFRNYETSAVRRRIREGMLAERVSTVSRFQEKVLHESAYLKRFLRAFATPGLSMFSDTGFYEVFRSKVTPLLRTYPYVRIWHAGCSTGQELYSIAILLEEEGLFARTRIYATDLSEEAIREARKGSYPLSMKDEYASNYIQAGGNKRFSDYYNRRGNRLLIDPFFKKHIVFSEHNLATDGSLNEFHVIVCRNVLATFNRALRERVDGLIYDSLGRFGVLALGAGESLEAMPHESRYTLLDEDSRLYQKLI